MFGIREPCFAVGRWTVTGFRPLLLFWASVLFMLAGSAAALQIMGPVRPSVAVVRSGAVPGTAPASKVEHPDAATTHTPAGSVGPTATPASLPPSSTQAVPMLPLTTASIPEADPAMLEPAEGMPGRMLPVVAAGHEAAQMYAAPFDPAERHPRVALVIDGMALDRAITLQAMRDLPSAIDFAYSAYAPPETSAELARLGRRQGRECLVSVPMEPSGFPASEEGGRAMLVGSDPAQNREDLAFALTAVTGCVGATGGSDGLNGERYAESTQAFAEMLAEVGHRGLLYLDARPGLDAKNGDANFQPTPLDAAAGTKPPRNVDVIVDREVTPGDAADAQAIDHNLALLEQQAAHRGSAIGLAGPPRPVLLDRIAVWAQGLAARGIVLAPVSAIAPPRPPMPETAP